jgi:hypothetical protein
MLLSGEAANTSFIVFGVTRPAIKPTIYREYANHYTTDLVIFMHELHKNSSLHVIPLVKL